MSVLHAARKASPRAARRVTAVLAASGIALVTAAGPAAAHVTVQPDETEAGGYAKLAFRVPNESDTAGTITLEVEFPARTPLSSVRVKPKDGWTADVVSETLDEPVEVGDYEITEAVTTVTWSAEDGVRIGPDEFDEFEVSVGPLPPADAGPLEFPATQTYDDGEVVEWNQTIEDGREHPDHPSPTLTLLPGSDGGHGSGTAGAGVSATSDGDAAASDDAAESTDSTARLLGGLGVGLAGVTLIVVIAGWVTIRRAARGDGGSA